jgi:hypothetical protein
VSKRKAETMKSTVLFCLILFVASCREDEKPLSKTEKSDSLVGRWLYVERGYSPGAGYITEPVPGTPVQTIQFFPDLTMDTDVEGLSDFKYYRLSKDITSEAVVLTLFRQNPDDGNPSNEVWNRYFVTWEGETLKLHQQGCIEGCHMGFRRVNEGGEE